jgi:hypothetical protein
VSRPVIVRVDKAGAATDQWTVRNRDGTIRTFLAPDAAPGIVRRGLAERRYAYFHAVCDDTGRLIYGTTAFDQHW